MTLRNLPQQVEYLTQDNKTINETVSKAVEDINTALKIVDSMESKIDTEIVDRTSLIKFDGVNTNINQGGTTKLNIGSSKAVLSEPLEVLDNIKVLKDSTNATIELDGSTGNVNSTSISTDSISTKTITVNDKNVATLESNGKIPASQLPSYVDDVLEYSSKSQFPSTGESGKIYIATDTNLTYRWSGSTYVEISESLALGETSSTAYPGDKGKTALETASSALSKANTNETNITKKQDKLTAGTNITIENNVISAAGTSDAVLKNPTSTPQEINGSIVINADSHAYNEGVRINGINGIGNFVISKESGNNNNILALGAENSFNDKKLIVVNDGTRYDILIPSANGTLALKNQIPTVGTYYTLLSITHTGSPEDWYIYIGIFAPNSKAWNYEGESGLAQFCDELNGFYMPAFGYTNNSYPINYIKLYYSYGDDYGFHVYYTKNGTVTSQKINLCEDSIVRDTW